MELNTAYLPNEIEDKWYSYWLKHRFFRSTPDGRKPYTIVMPPPNVTGILHMGHMLNTTLQDVLIRRARLKGLNACWVAGTDHASIATEAKVVAKLKSQGVEKSDLTREQFLAHAWDWTNTHGGIILEQLKKLGCSCDWDRTKFTMDEDLSLSVLKVFVQLYEQGKIYRGYRMVNWDVVAKTNISDEEVIFKQQQGKLYYLKYKVEGSDEYIPVATTRPETIFGDTALCVNPDDERYAKFIGKNVIIPVVNRVIPIISDSYVDRDFGTGALKITPAHDVNDYKIGQQHHLPIIDVLDENGKLNHHAMHYAGKDRFVVRQEIVSELKEKSLLLKEEDYINNVGTSERTGAVIEPRLSVQWFLKMEELVKPALSAIENGDLKLFPDHYKNTWRHWLENIHDWNISRQLWWGHQIPAYYYGSGQDDFVVALSKEEALEKAQKKSGKPLSVNDLKQDEDVLDTWFSSWLWPISVFDGINNPENSDFKYYYPTQDLVTGPDIIFFWVARMVMAGYEFSSSTPFSNVYFTGIVRDKQRRKMSKSLGNSPDALKLIEAYGADGVRVGLLLSSSAGNDLLFDEALCQQGKGFANKIWNAFRLLKSWQVSSESSELESSKKALDWYQARYHQVLKEVDEHFEKYRISDALMAVYKLLWGDFCSWTLEMIKPAYGTPMSEVTYQRVVSLFEKNLLLLHSFMPFITEELWQGLKERKAGDSLMIQSYPEQVPFDEKILSEFEVASEVISAIRTIRKEKNIPFKTEVSLYVNNNQGVTSSWDCVIEKMGNIDKIYYTDEKPQGAISFRVKANEYFIPLQGSVDVSAEIQKLNEELAYTEGFLRSVEKKLSNERFVLSAPAPVVENERKKQADAQAKIEMIHQRLKELNYVKN